MPDEKPPQIAPPSRGFFRQTALQIKLVWRLLRDRRVHPLLKLLPVASVVYLVFPDILPGPIDDTAVVLGGFWLFIELCPPGVVKEHWDELNSVVPGVWREVKPKELPGREEDASLSSETSPKKRARTSQEKL